MHSSSHTPLLLSFLLLLPLSTTATLCSDPTSRPGDVPIFHVQSRCTPFSSRSTPPSLTASLVSSALGDPARLAYLSSLVSAASKPATKVPVSSGIQFMSTNNYVLRGKFGTPGQLLFLALDTATDSAWIPCSGCVGCPSSNASFSPASSSTYKSVDCASEMCPRFKGLGCGGAASSGGSCGFNMTYGGDTSLTATLAQDSLRLGLDVMPAYPFGCVNYAVGGNSMPKQGLLGLGRGPNGLLAQSGSLYQGVFSYCLPSFKSYYFSGSLRLGPIGQPRTIRTTPLLLNPHRPSLYYVNLMNVSVGKVTVVVPPGSFDFNTETGAGTVVDSGTVITRFVGPAYTAIRDEFRRQVNAANYSSLGDQFSVALNL